MYKNRIPDFRQMYPEASEEVIELLKKTERKMQYQEYDLKIERSVVDQETQTQKIIPSREDSYERLLEQSVQFLETESAEEEAIRNIELEQLHKALSYLTDEEKNLIWQFYFLGNTEREIAEKMGVYHNAIHKRKLRILSKLKKIIKNFDF